MAHKVLLVHRVAWVLKEVKEVKELKAFRVYKVYRAISVFKATPDLRAALVLKVHKVSKVI